MSGYFPNLTLKVTEPGSDTAIDLAPFLAWEGATGQTNVTGYFGNQGDTAQLVLVDDYSATVPGFDVPRGTPHFAIKPLSTVVLTDEGATEMASGGIIFAGLVTNPQWAWKAPGFSEWTLQCVDFTYYADTAVVQGTYAGLTADEVVIALVNQANCGLIAKSVKDGGHVYPGPTLPLLDIPYGQLSQALGTVVSQSSISQVYGWFVDPNREVWFYPTSVSVPSGVTVTDVPTPTDGSYVPGLYECHVDGSMAYSMLYERDATTFYTRVVVEGATATYSFDSSAAQKGTINPTDSWVGNGVQRSWPLSYVPEVTSSTLSKTISVDEGSTSETLYLTVGGEATAVSINTGNTTVTTPYEIIQATNGLWTLQVTPGVGATPGAGVKIKIWYDYQLPIIAIANNRAQQAAAGGPNGGVFSDFVQDTSLTSVAAALSQAKAVLTEYGAPQERFTFYTDESWFGVMRCGQTYESHLTQVPNSANGDALGLDGLFFVNQQMTIFVPGGFRKTQVTSVRLA